jgi:hypothetical protein
MEKLGFKDIPTAYLKFGTPDLYKKNLTTEYKMEGMNRNKTRRNRNRNRRNKTEGGKRRKTHRGKTHKRRHSRKARK